MRYLSVGSNAKTAKSDALGVYETAIQYLAPASLSGVNLCPWSTAGCRAACLNTAGRGAFQNVQDARIKKAREMLEGWGTYKAQLMKDIGEHVRKCRATGKKPVIRLNGTSDILWERIAPEIFTAFPDVQFYDYTKAPHAKRSRLPANYSLTYSAHEGMGADEIRAILATGNNVAIVFHGKALPETWEGMPVVNGDAHDLRFLDPRGVIVGLLAKGKAKRDQSGFVREVA